MKVLVCGGRDFKDGRLVYETLDRLHREHGITGIIEGGAKGADTAAYSWAKIHHLHDRTYPADWTKHGRAAGPIRNATMLAEGNPDVVIAFPGGTGTAHMVRLARNAGVEVIEVRAHDAHSVGGESGT